MARGGNNRKPTVLKVLKGTVRPSRENKHEPQMPAGAPDCPEHLDDDAKREWFRVVPSLVGASILTRVDHAALAAYCQNFSRWIAAEQEIAKAGITFIGDNGMIRRHPAVGIAHDAMMAIKAFACEYGLTPVSRARVSPVGAEKKAGDGWDSL